ncbi:hypothetical protein Q9S78_11955 [Microbacterium sp. KSW-18]|uniref:Uncharacterized protein n=1 Tax=Microbacterium aquilitoris TaxID=3067307 RepID=A0ABU3GL08_9MICO|nr:hypothetical protein [Microbacterium sp. KSW-18]MDT3331382.1 hypothetical protein [Microbacterium sp. KSW-18]
MALPKVANDKAQAVALGDAVLGRSDTYWSLADAARRWPSHVHRRWADVPCPKCDLKVVEVLESTQADLMRYRCSSCEWTADSVDDDGLWLDLFTLGEEVEVRPHDPRWLTRPEAARLARATPATVMRWAERSMVRSQLGRYWRDDVVVMAERRAATA